MSVKPIKAVPADVPFFRGDCADAAFVAEIMDRYQVEAIIHFAARTGSNGAAHFVR
jgi:UDP-glucose 4-epimerase